MNKPTPHDFLKSFVGINLDGEFVFRKKILKHFPSRRQQAEEWARDILVAALENLKKKEESKLKKESK